MGFTDEQNMVPAMILAGGERSDQTYHRTKWEVQ